MLKNNQTLFTIDAQQKNNEAGNSVLCVINIINQHSIDMRDVTLDIFIPKELSFVKGKIKRMRGELDFQEKYKDLVIGNLASEESVIIEFVAKINQCDAPLKIKGYATIKYKLYNKIIKQIKKVSFTIEDI